MILSSELGTGSSDDRQLTAFKAEAYLDRLITDRDWARVFRTVRSGQFLEDLHREASRPSSQLPSLSPCSAIEQVLSIAIEHRVAREIAWLSLAHSDWAGRPHAVTPLEAWRSGDRKWAQSLADSSGSDSASIWRLVLAWEAVDSGDVGTARSLLHDIIANDPARVGGAHARRVVSVLAVAFEIDHDLARQLVKRLLDDEGRIRLSQRLTLLAKYDHALIVASLIDTVNERITELAAICQSDQSGMASGLAMNALLTASRDLGDVDGDKDLAISLARVGAAGALVQGSEPAFEMFDRAVKTARSVKDRGARDDALHIVACIQLLTGMTALAEETARHMTSTGPPVEVHATWETLEAIAAAYAQIAEPEHALRVLAEVKPEYADYSRAVRRIARLVDNRSYAQLRSLTSRADPWDREELDQAVESVALTRPRFNRDASFDSRRHWIPSSARMMIENFAGIRRATAAGVSEEHFNALLAEDDSRRAMLMSDCFYRSDMHDWLRPRRTGTPCPPVMRGSRRERTISVYSAFRDADQDLYDLPLEPAYESDRLWDRADDAARANKGTWARSQFAEALQLDQFENFRRGDDDESRQRSVFTADFHWLRGVAVARIAADIKDTSVTGYPNVEVQKLIQLAASVAGRLPTLERTRVEVPLACAELELGRVDAALRRCAVNAKNSVDSRFVAVECLRHTILTEEPVDNEQLRALLREIGDGPVGDTDDLELLQGKLGSLLVEMGDVDAALELAMSAENDYRQSAVEARIAERVALSGDIDRAYAIACDISNFSMKADALRCIGLTASVMNGDRGRAISIFEDAGTAARNLWPIHVPAALTEIAQSQAVAGLSGAAQQNASEAFEVVRVQEGSGKTAEILTAISELHAMLGHGEDAVRAADAIEHPWYRPRALYRVLTRSGSSGEPADVLNEVEDLIENPWWRAAACAATAIAHNQGSARVGVHRSWQDVERLVEEIPRGESRDRLLELIARGALKSSENAIALRCISEMSGNVDFRLLRLGAILADSADATVLFEFLPYYVGRSVTALFACVVLAKLFPESAGVVASEIAEYGGQPLTRILHESGEVEGC